MTSESRIITEALNGGKHAGLLKTYMDKPVQELLKGIRNIKKQIARHEKWIKEPTEKVMNFYDMDEIYQKGLIEKWKRDIARQKEQAELFEEIIKIRCQS